MPRKRTSDSHPETTEPDASSPPKMATRRSARLADAAVTETKPVTPSPTKKTPPAKKARKSQEPKEKAVKKSGKKEKAVASTSDAAPSASVAEEDFVHVNAEEVPAANSQEVKDAIAAQGEDGELLVGFVQVAKDEVPAEGSAEVEEAVAKAQVPAAENSAENTNGDVAPEPEDAGVNGVEEKQQDEKEVASADSPVKKSGPEETVTGDNGLVTDGQQ